MSTSDSRSESRRQFLKLLSGSPLLAYSGLGTIAADGPIAPPRLSLDAAFVALTIPPL